MSTDHATEHPATQDGADAPAPQAWASLIERMLKGLETGSRQWPVGRRKDTVQRMLVANRNDSQRLRQRLEALVASWEGERAGSATVETPAGHGAQGPTTGSGGLGPAVAPAAQAAPAAASAGPTSDWVAVLNSLELTVRAALPRHEARATDIGDDLLRVTARLKRDGASARSAQDLEEACERARRLIAHRHRLVDELGKLCSSLSEGLVELSEDESWARGQADALRQSLSEESGVRGVRAATEMLAEARARQQRVRLDRDAARNALRAMLPQMLTELAALGEQTGRFEGSIGRHADAIKKADSLESLAGVVSAMVDETRSVHQAVGNTRTRLHEESRRAEEMNRRVLDLESELQRLSQEVSTDSLTRVNNRRGLEAAFQIECAKIERHPAPLCIGLIDIDNFKKLNDSLGHAAGDVALKSLASRVKKGLRPVDTVARFGGEEFVVLLPATPLGEGQETLSRLQRSLTKSLFLHEAKEVFVTFSAGVTLWRPNETLQTALERADEALYEAKRSGKNRTCIG